MPFRFSILYLPSIALALVAFGAQQASTNELTSGFGWSVVGVGILAQMLSSGSVSAELYRLEKELSEKTV